MKINKALSRERKINKRKNGHRRDGDSVKTIQKIQQKRRDTILQKYREIKEQNLELNTT